MTILEQVDSPGTVYALGLAGASVVWETADDGGLLPIRDWRADRVPGDEDLLARCLGPTLDIGCGPGRLAAALAGQDVPCLGIDVHPRAVDQARRRGATALVRDVFAAIPRAGSWQHVLLADGNIGIGGDPLRLLARCRTLLAADGTVLLDLAPDGVGLRRGSVRLRAGDRRSDWFSWAWLDLAGARAVAAATGLELVGSWTGGGRQQAELAVSNCWGV